MRVLSDAPSFISYIGMVFVSCGVLLYVVIDGRGPSRLRRMPQGRRFKRDVSRQPLPVVTCERTEARADRYTAVSRLSECMPSMSECSSLWVWTVLMDLRHRELWEALDDV